MPALRVVPRAPAGGTDTAPAFACASGSERSRPEEIKPEIRLVDLAGAVLQLLPPGETDIMRFLAGAAARTEQKAMKRRKAETARRLQEVEDRFVDLWDTMSSLWGISPTMARIHGLLYITGAALSMDDIMERLTISRGNVSMNLSKLVEWGLVRRVHKRGDRKDYYESLSDVWEMFALVAQQRKRREIDPIVSTLRRCRDELTDEGLGEDSHDAEARARFRRVHDLLDFLRLMEGLAQRFFESNRGLRQAVDLLAEKG
jgi:HTH-type transcriptional regulator, glycine betaine synthesis regulator